MDFEDYVMSTNCLNEYFVRLFQVYDITFDFYMENLNQFNRNSVLRKFPYRIFRTIKKKKNKLKITS